MDEETYERGRVDTLIVFFAPVINSYIRHYFGLICNVESFNGCRPCSYFFLPIYLVHSRLSPIERLGAV
jgi:hypothetical protein